MIPVQFTQRNPCLAPLAFNVSGAALQVPPYVGSRMWKNVVLPFAKALLFLCCFRLQVLVVECIDIDHLWYCNPRASFDALASFPPDVRHKRLAHLQR
jgi:hypothetical protein